MHYKAMGDLTHTGSLTDRIHKFLVSEYGSFYEAMRDLRNSSASFVALDYGVLTKQPAYSLDFINEYYRAAGVKSNLNPAVTHSASSNATMIGSDGNIKWRPHNLLPYSEDFSNSVWLKYLATVTSNVTTAPDGTNSAYSVVSQGSGGAVYKAISASGSHTWSIFAKAFSTSYLKLRSSNTGEDTSFNLSGAGSVGTSNSNHTASIESVGNGWYRCVVTSNLTNNRFSIFPVASDGASGASGDSLYIWGAHLFRSDLGGMVNNPDRGDSYVPTTSSAVYLPRVGHHIYNGDAWVNEGVLHESEARTNLVTYSNDFANAEWLKTRAVISANNTTSPSGATDATLIIPQSGGWAGVTFPSISITSGTTYTGSIYAKAGEYSWLQIGGSSPRFAATFANVNLSNGSLGNSNIGVIVTPVGNGWYRITLTAVASQSTTGNPFFVAVYDTDVSSRLPDSPNDGTSGIYLYGTQFEQGSTPSSYIPTSGSTVTRAAETLTVPSANLPYSSTNMSIQMDGRMTYADDDSISTNPRFFQWRIDTSGGIDASNSTLTSRNSWVGFRQYAGGVVDDVSTNANVYSSGINVPFNIASRHGSTFINGAIDGTALTANTTPIALPDLSSTDLQLGYDFMGTIGKFRVWSDDLTDTGIATASAPSTEPSLQLTFDGSSTSSFTVLDWSE